LDQGNIFAKKFPSNAVFDSATFGQIVTPSASETTVATPVPLISSIDDPSNHVVPAGTGYDGVVQIDTSSAGGGFGSGALIAGTNFILTAAHVVTQEGTNLLFALDAYAIYFDLPTGRVKYSAAAVYVMPGWTGSNLNDGVDMALIELGVVMSIVTAMLALVLGLSRHVNEVIKYRRAQAELGEWHETLHAWYLKYGMYPDPYFQSGHMESNLLWLASSNENTQYRALNDDGSLNAQIPSFCSLFSKPLKTIDPWGTPYFYQSLTNSYELLSCGPNTKHTYSDAGSGGATSFPEGTTASTDSNDDDVHFEP